MKKVLVRLKHCHRRAALRSPCILLHMHQIPNKSGASVFGKLQGQSRILFCGVSNEIQRKKQIRNPTSKNDAKSSKINDMNVEEICEMIKIKAKECRRKKKA